MAFNNPPDETIATLLRQAKTIAVVGLSDNPRRPSYEVADALQDYGYRIIAVNPSLSVWEGHRAIAGLDEAATLLQTNERIDIVDVFRSAEHVDAIVDTCLRLKLPALWLQLGVINEGAAQRASDAGMIVVMDRCMKIERMRLDRPR